MKSVQPVSKIFDSRREYPRLQLNIPLSLRRTDGVTIEAILHDLSPNGAQIRYTGDRADLLPTLQISSKDLKSLKYLLSFHLANADNTTAINIEARPVYARRLKTGETAMGMLFDCGLKKEKDKIQKLLMLLGEPSSPEDSNPSITETIVENIGSMSSTCTADLDNKKNELFLHQLMRIRNSNKTIRDALDQMISMFKSNN